jgi:phage gp29-like protein
MRMAPQTLRTLDRPPVSPFKTLPIQTFTGFDTVYAINGALYELEMGNFRRAAILSDATGRDDRITGVTSTRVGALLAADLDLKPADERAKAKKAAELLGGTEDAPGNWEKVVDPGMASSLLKAGLHLNMGVAEILWTYVDQMWWPRLSFWHTQFVRWDTTKERYLIATANKGDVELPRLDDNAESEGDWLMWCPFGYRFAWLAGLIRSLAPMFMRRMWVNRDWSRYCEVHGMPITKAIVPGLGGLNTSQDEFLWQVANRGSEPTIMVRQGEDGNKYDVQLLEATAQTYQTFKDSKADVNTDIAVLVLGQNLSTEAAGGGLGGGQVAQHNLVRLDKAKEDAAFASAIYHQVLRPWARFNFGDPDLAPRPIYRVEPPVDNGQKASVLKSLGDGIQSLNAAKIPVNIRQTAEDFGVVLISVEEEAAAKAVAAEEAAALAEAAAQAAAAKGAPQGPAGEGGAAPAGAAPGTTPTAALSAADVQAQPKSPKPVVARYKFAGLPIAVEHARGSTRVFRDAQGKTSETLVLHDYGFIEGHAGSDGEELDCYVGPNEDASHVHVVHQLKAPDFTKHDEDKLMLGFKGPDAAKAAYVGNRSDAKAYGGMSTIPMDRFKAKLNRRTGTGKIRAAAVPDETFAAIMAMADSGVVELRARTGKIGKKSKRYPDALTQRALALGARALAVDLAGLKAEVKDATTFAELEKNIVTFYRDRMDSAKLAKLIQRTRLMANLTGRLTVLKGS